MSDDGVSPLGAAAPQPVGKSQKKKGGGSRRGLPRRALGKVRHSLPTGATPVLAIAVVVLLALVPAVWSALKKTPEYKVGISYGDGPFEGRHFQKIVQPGSNLFFNGFGDPLYLYPADQRSYLVSGSGGGSEGEVQDPAIVAPSRDQVEVRYDVATYFKLNTERLQDFHQDLGRKYKAYTDKGWSRMLRENFRPQLQNALQEQTRRFDVETLYSSSELLTQVQRKVQQRLAQRLEAALGQRYFCSPTFRAGGPCEDITVSIRDIRIPEPVQKAFENNRTQRIEIRQRQAQSESIDAFNEALGEAGMNYVLLRAIESGKVDFWVLPDESGFTLDTPESPGASPDGDSSPSPGGAGSSSDGEGASSPDGAGSPSPGGQGSSSPGGGNQVSPVG